MYFATLYVRGHSLQNLLIRQIVILFVSIRYETWHEAARYIFLIHSLLSKWYNGI